MLKRVNLSLKEIYAKLCPKCKEAVQDLVMQKLTREQVKKALEGDKKK